MGCQKQGEPGVERRPMLLELAVGDAYGAGFEFAPGMHGRAGACRLCSRVLHPV
ncbi:hypothetical protein [Corallococcus sp. AB018]|uniref:hypothetical protein n=1 Tax=Corallococcus sp. AB018 TaxID=2316715 RepID=UPI0013156F7D|nr:hypothetical protein [Corallococcus sp. AB018]